MTAAARTKHSIDRATFTITFERTFAAPREDVFAAWTDPAQLTVWWDPSGTPLRKCSVDLRPGGAFELVNEGHSPPFAGVYRVIEPPSLLVFEAMGAVGTVRLAGDRAKTNMTVTIRCPSAEHLEHFVNLGVAAGTDQTLDNLVAHVTKRAA